MYPFCNGILSFYHQTAFSITTNKNTPKNEWFLNELASKMLRTRLPRGGGHQKFGIPAVITNYARMSYIRPRAKPGVAPIPTMHFFQRDFWNTFNVRILGYVIIIISKKGFMLKVLFLNNSNFELLCWHGQ